MILIRLETVSGINWITLSPATARIAPRRDMVALHGISPPFLTAGIVLLLLSFLVYSQLTSLLE